MTGKLWLCRSKITPYLRFAGIAERGAERLGVGHDAWQSFPLRYFGRATLSAAFIDISSGSAPESRFLYPRRVEPRRARPLPTIGRHADGLEHTMKIALLVLLGLVVGALGGAALGIGAGLAWTQIFRTTAGFEGYNGMLVFFTFMPLGAAIGGLGGAFLFGVIAIRDAEIALEQKPAHRRDR